MSATERTASRPASRPLAGVAAAAMVFLLPATAAAAPDDVPPGRYHVVSALTGQCLALGTGVAELAKCGGGATAWDIIPAAKDAQGALLIRHVNTCLGNGGGVTVAACGGKAQEWTFQKTDAGDVTIASAADRTVLAVVPAADETAGDTVHLATPANGDGEVWLLQDVR